MRDLGQLQELLKQPRRSPVANIFSQPLDEQEFLEPCEEPAAEPERAPEPEPKAPEPKQPSLVYLNVPYGDPASSWAGGLKTALKTKNVLAFSPLSGVNEQFDPQDLPFLNTPLKIPQALLKLLRLSEALTLPITDPSVDQMLAAGDRGFDATTLLFKEMYFLLRSSVVICDFIKPPYAIEVASKLFYCRVLDIPTIGVSPSGQLAHPWLVKNLRAVLTDDFTPANIYPLVRGFLDS